jgi:hypothetical protein
MIKEINTKGEKGGERKKKMEKEERVRGVAPPLI